MPNDNQRKMREIQFVNLISALAASAMQQLGKLVNPISGKTEVNLLAAKTTIDMLEMLRDKTQGNCNEDETALLRSTITNLQLNYVDQANAPKDTPAAPSPAQEEPGKKQENSK